MILGMSVPVPQMQPSSHAVAAFIERHDTLRMVMEWIADRFADAPEPDTSIDWEDGEDHDDEDGPAAL